MDPDNRQRSCTRLGDHNDAEGNREQIAQDEPPLVLNELAQLDRAIDLQHADEARPAGDKHQQHERRHAWDGSVFQKNVASGVFIFPNAKMIRR
jgi:hypothetical protein